MLFVVNTFSLDFYSYITLFTAHLDALFTKQATKTRKKRRLVLSSVDMSVDWMWIWMRRGNSPFIIHKIPIKLMWDLFVSFQLSTKTYKWVGFFLFVSSLSLMEFGLLLIELCFQILCNFDVTQLMRGCLIWLDCINGVVNIQILAGPHSPIGLNGTNGSWLKLWHWQWETSFLSMSNKYETI